MSASSTPRRKLKFEVASGTKPDRAKLEISSGNYSLPALNHKTDLVLAPSAAAPRCDRIADREPLNHQNNASQ